MTRRLLGRKIARDLLGAAGLERVLGLLLIDADTFVTNPLDPIWAYEFDLAYASKPRERFRLNGGVIFLRISPVVKRFVSAWLEENHRLLLSPQDFAPWRKTHGGINQAALGSVLHREAGGLRVRQLSCREWNCEDSAWSTFDPAITRIVHVKSDLRNAAVFKRAYPDELHPLVAAWRTAEKASRVGREAVSA